VKLLNPRARGAQELLEALAESADRTKGRPGDREEIKVVLQGGRIIDVIGAPRRWKILDGGRAK